MTKALDLARRAVACKHFRWMPGMRLVEFDGDEAARIVVMQDDGNVRVSRESGGNYGYSGEAWPDLTDPATVGCLLALVREAWGDRRMFTTYDDSDTQWPWDVWIPNRRSIRSGKTEAEALVAALEAAP